MYSLTSVIAHAVAIFGCVISLALYKKAYESENMKSQIAWTPSPISKWSSFVIVTKGYKLPEFLNSLFLDLVVGQVLFMKQPCIQQLVLLGFVVDCVILPVTVCYIVFALLSYINYIMRVRVTSRQELCKLQYVLRKLKMRKVHMSRRLAAQQLRVENRQRRQLDITMKLKNDLDEIKSQMSRLSLDSMAGSINSPAADPFGELGRQSCTSIVSPRNLHEVGLDPIDLSESQIEGTQNQGAGRGRGRGRGKGRGKKDE